MNLYKHWTNYWWIMWRQMTIRLFSLQFSSVSQSCPTLCNPMHCRMPGFPVHHQLLELTQTHFHWVGDAIQPFHPLSSPTPLAFNLSQHRVFSNESVLCIRWPSIGASASTSVLPVNIQHWFPLGLIGLISLKSKGFARVFSNTTVQKYQFFFSAQLSSVLNCLYGPTLTSIRDYWKNHSFG